MIDTESRTTESAERHDGRPADGELARRRPPRPSPRAAPADDRARGRAPADPRRRRGAARRGATTRSSPAWSRPCARPRSRAATRRRPPPGRGRGARRGASAAAPTDEAAGLRKRADEDIAAIREWSKTEIARVRAGDRATASRRAETELTGETQRHAASVERLVDEVQSTVAAFEADMEQFFKRLLAENDPARLAALAEQAPGCRRT